VTNDSKLDSTQGRRRKPLLNHIKEKSTGILKEEALDRTV